MCMRGKVFWLEADVSFTPSPTGSVPIRTLYHAAIQVGQGEGRPAITTKPIAQ